VKMMPDDKIMEIMAVAGSAAFMGMVGWVSHALAIMKEVDYRRLVGGMLFAAFTSSVSCMLMMATDMNVLYAAPLGAMIGASGEYGFNFMLERWLKKQHGGGQ
jgi:hypothetical protein